MNLSSGVEASEQVLCADAACCTVRCLLHAACCVQRCLLHAEISLLAAKFLSLCCTFRCLLLAACYLQNAALFAAGCKIPQRCCMLAACFVHATCPMMPVAFIPAACCMLHAAYCVFGYMPHQHQRQYNTIYKPSTATMKMKQQKQALRCAVLWRKQSPSLPIPK